MLAADVMARLGAKVPELSGRMLPAADLAKLIADGKLPAAPVAGFVVPGGLRPQSKGDAAAGAFTQMIDEVIALVLVVKAAGDVSGAKSMPKLDQLVENCLAALSGWQPSLKGIAGVMRLSRGQFLSMNGGSMFYQLEFSLQRQIRILS
jgi:hypothetical protein